MGSDLSGLIITYRFTLCEFIFNRQLHNNIKLDVSFLSQYISGFLLDDLSLVGPTGVQLFSWTSVAPECQSWFAVEFSSYFISVMNLDLYVVLIQ